MGPGAVGQLLFRGQNNWPKKLGALLGVSAATVRGWETSGSIPPEYRAEMLALVLVEIENDVGSSPALAAAAAVLAEVPVGGGAAWGGITGTLADQTDLNSALAAKAPLLTEVYGRLASTYTLTSQTAAQKLFNWSTNGAVSISAGIWEFDCLFQLSSMSATSGNARFSLAGTATIADVSMAAQGIDNTTPANSGTLTGSYAVASQSNASVVTAGTGTGMWAHVRGVFSCTVAGTLVPSVSLVTAAAAVVAAGSYFRARQIGTGTALPVGSWS